MIIIQPAFSGSDLISGMTLVATNTLPWPGASFSISESADAAHVERSYEALSIELGVPRDRIATVHQVHGRRCWEVGSVDACASARSEQADALVTALPGIVLGVKLADCCGVLLHDPVRHVVAAIHSGWRGTAEGISWHIVKLLASSYDSSPRNIQAWLSPCASGRVYEVGPDVHAVLGGYCQPLSEGKWLFDNHRAIADQLASAGLQMQNIHVDPACTISNERYHSYRRDRGRSGRMLAFIGMREKP